ncbi:alpha/beta hydrolase family protein [Homoserinimonas aerilata]|uniref:Alpha/beta hydrolase family protein n=2 Tax=Homoserinimonas aerilata TaxID=1162970 RepID=A0A542YHT1_9MICO|nr:alpha/beta hydrolase family protein [Homoserinimonas aerilata]
MPRFIAIVATLVVLVGVTGVFVEHISTSASTAEREGTQNSASSGFGGSRYNAVVQGLPTLSAPVDFDRLADSSGVELLRQLGELDQVSIGRFADAHPEKLSALVALPPLAHDVAGWWSEIGAEPRRALVLAVPGVIGNLQGVPYEVRDAANRSYLKSSIVMLERAVAEGAGRAADVALQAQLRMLRQIELALGDRGTVPARSLIAVDIEWPGRAAVALGDLSTADFVSYLVPGMFFTVDGQIVDWTTTAQALHSEELTLLGSIRQPDGSASVTHSSIATVAWMGYETPTVFTVGELALANEGADRIAQAIGGLRAVRAGDQPFVTLITHSYGSTAASIALSDGVTAVDALAIVGSPGVVVASASDLAVRAGNVFVGEASWDPVVLGTFYGHDPAGEAFGARPIGVTGGTDDLTGIALAASTGHNGYFVPGSECLRNLALISLGSGDLVMGDAGAAVLASGQSNTQTFAQPQTIVRSPRIVSLLRG